MKKKHIVIVIISFASLYLAISFAKSVNFYISKFDSVFEKASKLEENKLKKDSVKIYDLNNHKQVVLNLNNQEKDIIIHFWATTCKPCIEEFDELTEFYKKNKTKYLLYVISQEKKEIQLSFLDKKKFNLPFYYLDKDNYFLTLDSIPIPYTAFIKNNKIVKSHIGKINWKLFKP